MQILLHPHAEGRLEERGATKEEVLETIEHGEKFPVKYGRTGFRRNFLYNKMWREKSYTTKQIEAYAVLENTNWIVITFLTKFF